MISWWEIKSSNCFGRYFSTQGKFMLLLFWSLIFPNFESVIAFFYCFHVSQGWLIKLKLKLYQFKIQRLNFKTKAHQVTNSQLIFYVLYLVLNYNHVNYCSTNSEFFNHDSKSQTIQLPKSPPNLYVKTENKTLCSCLGKWEELRLTDWDWRLSSVQWCRRIKSLRLKNNRNKISIVMKYF